MITHFDIETIPGMMNMLGKLRRSKDPVTAKVEPDALSPRLASALRALRHRLKNP